MNMKMRKNFALLAVLAIAVFVASAGLASAEEKKSEGEYCDSDSECKSGDCREHGNNNPEEDGVCIGNAVTGGPTSIDETKAGIPVSQATGLLDSGNGTCEDGTCDLPGTLVRESGETRFVPGERSVSLGESGVSFTCGNENFRVTKTGSGEGSAAQVAAGGTGEDVDLETTRHCTGEEDCPGDMKCAEGEGICYWPSDDEEQVTGPQEGQEVTEDDAVEDPRDQDSGGFLGIEGLFTAN